MPQIEFDGIGERIPTIALPPFGSDSNLPPTMFTFTDNADFLVAQYRELGFTHFEAWCVGAAGGRGGDASSSVIFAIERILRPVPADVWALRLELVRTQDYYLTGEWDHLYGGPGGTQMTMVQFEEYNNPSHSLMFNTYKQVAIFPSTEGIGGAGGGGGFQKVAGLLSDLPDLVPIVVGKTGADAPVGQVHQFGIWTPEMPLVYLDPAAVPYPQSRIRELSNYFLTYLNSYPVEHASFDNPQPGGNGGASTFGGDICQASGGVGGSPGMIWDGVKFVIKGDGGAGGLGGRVLPGGGGAGSVAEAVNGADGIWHPDTGIGAGGGGGKGGRNPEYIGDPRFGVPTQINHLATAGGQGSYSFADTTVYGQRQYRLPWTYMKPTDNNGVLTFAQVVDSNYLITPGGGGGARPTKNLKVGSRATGYSPNGAVVVRLTRIT